MIRFFDSWWLAPDALTHHSHICCIDPGFSLFIPKFCECYLNHIFSSDLLGVRLGGNLGTFTSLPLSRGPFESVMEAGISHPRGLSSREQEDHVNVPDFFLGT